MYSDAMIDVQRLLFRVLEFGLLSLPVALLLGLGLTWALTPQQMLRVARSKWLLVGRLALFMLLGLVTVSLAGLGGPQKTLRGILGTLMLVICALMLLFLKIASLRVYAAMKIALGLVVAFRTTSELTSEIFATVLAGGYALLSGFEDFKKSLEGTEPATDVRTG
jgi:hypothetical protein